MSHVRAAHLAVLYLMLWVSGCASNAPGPSTHPSTATAPAKPPELFYTLDQIKPYPILPQPVAHPTSRPPLAALQLFAQARAARDRGQYQLAVGILQHAIRIDPNSPDLYEELAKACQEDDALADVAISALDRALLITPDDLSLQYQLGQLYLTKGDISAAILHLRLALQTTAYKSDSDVETELLTDYFLAKALAHNGYARAALDQLDVFIQRLNRSNTDGANLELGYLGSHLELLYADIGELYEKLGNLPLAVQAYQKAAERDPDNFKIQSSVLRLLAVVGRKDAAREDAAEFLLRFHAAPQAVAAVRDAFAQAGLNLAQTLDDLHHLNPQNRSIFFALVDEFEASGKIQKSRDLLTEWSARDNDPRVLRKLCALDIESKDVAGAMRLLVEALAQKPDSLADLTPAWDKVIEDDVAGRTRLKILRDLKVDDRFEASRLYWIARLAELWNRNALAQKSAMESASRHPPFAPAYRLLAHWAWDRSADDVAHKAAACEEIANQARQAGQASLADELQGLSLLNQGRAADAVAPLELAASLGDRGPDQALLLAAAYKQTHRAADAVKTLNAVLTADKYCEDAYATLIDIQLHSSQGDEAAKTLRRWLQADPGSVDARLLQVDILGDSRDPESIAAAHNIIESLLAEEPASSRVLNMAVRFYSQQGSLKSFLDLLEKESLGDPHNRALIETLIIVYADQARITDARRLLDAQRIALAHDPDELYLLAHLYERIKQPEMTEQILEEVLKIDPEHAPAANDLGYTWADQGKNLARAQRLIQMAVDAEPDNQSFLDSMGWVKYKQGQFAAARDFLERALQPEQWADPVVLDHMGDTLYRLGRAGDAVHFWKSALQRLKIAAATDDESVRLKQNLELKLLQEHDGQSITVAPVVENSK